MSWEDSRRVGGGGGEQSVGVKEYEIYIHAFKSSSFKVFKQGVSNS